jgi:hypothetical protein
MRKGFLGSIAALAAGAGGAFAQPPAEPVGPPLKHAAAAAAVRAQAPEPTPGGPTQFGGLPFNALPGNAGFAPPPAIMPPGNFGPGYDPLGLGPVGGFGPPPGPMYPVPGPYAQQSFQPAPDEPLGGGGGGDPGTALASRLWFDGEYLLWFTRGQEVRSPLLTSSAPADAGVIGASSTAILVGNRALSYGAMSGARFTAGFFGDVDRRIGFQLQGFFTEHAPFRYNTGDLNNTAGIPVLARPFVDVNTGRNSAVVLSGLNFGAATARVRSYHQTIGVEPVGVWNIYRAEPGAKRLWSVDLLAGYKFLQVRESVSVDTFTQFDNQTAFPVFTGGPFGQVNQNTQIVPAQGTLGGAVVGGVAVVRVQDEFRATNRFNGAVLGLKLDGRYGMFTTSATLRTSVGNMHERMEIMGASTFIDPLSQSGNPTGFGFASGVGGNGGSVGGVLANPGNIGTYVRDRFTYIPEVGVTFGIALTRGITAYIGGNFIYFPDVIRPGSAINPMVSGSSIPFTTTFGNGGARSPSFRFIEEDLWLGGATFGLTFRY